MPRIRVIPCLLLHEGGLVKTVKFKNPVYVGDPINAVKIFNEKEVDELIFLDISATAQKRKPNLKLIHEIATECFMPLAYGGGVNTLDDVKAVLTTGVEKVVINAAAAENPGLLTEAARLFGSQAVIASIDVGKNWLGKYQVMTRNGSVNIKKDPVAYAKELVSAGAGEIFLHSIDRDGTYTGFDIPLIASVASAVDVPLIASGGARHVEDMREAVVKGHASAVSAGSLFVFKGPHRAVLINFPTQAELKEKLYPPH